MKRLLDILTALILGGLLSPAWAIAALAVKLGDGGPVLFAQTRVGLGGRPFRMLKFRTMVVGAETSGPYFTTQTDSRITPVGRWLRRSSLDEIPQLLNVLWGDMSLIGPRPDTPAQRALYSDADWHERHRVRPGITGLAQVAAKQLDDDQTSRSQRLALDLDYVRNHGLGRDLAILGRTVAKVARLGNH